MDERDFKEYAEPFVLIAHREADEFGRELALGMALSIGFWTVVLIFMAFYHVPIRWIAVVLFVGGTTTTSMMVVSVARRLDKGRSYLEQIASIICRDISSICEKM